MLRALIASTVRLRPSFTALPPTLRLLQVRLYTTTKSTMPPKKISKKRAREETPDTDAEREAEQASTSTKPKASGSKKKAKASPSENTQPTNTALPAEITFPPKSEGTTRIATWNVCGLAASQKKVRNSRKRIPSELCLHYCVLRGSSTTLRQRMPTF